MHGKFVCLFINHQCMSLFSDIWLFESRSSAQFPKRVKDWSVCLDAGGTAESHWRHRGIHRDCQIQVITDFRYNLSICSRRLYFVTITSSATVIVMSSACISCSGWDYVISGLIELGLSLVDEFGPKAAASASHTDSHRSQATSPLAKSSALGANVLMTTFKVRPKSSHIFRIGVTLYYILHQPDIIFWRLEFPLSFSINNFVYR